MHSLPHPLTRARKPRQPIRRSSSYDVDDSTVMEPWNLTPTLLEKTSNPTTVVQSLDVADVPVATAVKKPKITRPGAISRRKRGVIDIFSRDLFSPKPVKRKQKRRANEKLKQICAVKDTPPSVKKSPVCAVSADRASPMSKSTLTDLEGSEPPRWLPKKSMPNTPMVLQTEPPLKKHKPSMDDTLPDEESKLIIDE